MPHRTDAQRLLDALQRTGALLAADADLETLMQNVTDAVTELTAAEFGAFFYNEVDAAVRMKLFTVSGVDPAGIPDLGHPRCTELFKSTVQDRQIVRSPDITRDPRFRGMPKGHFTVRSYLAVPVVSHGRTVGTLLAGHSGAGKFRPQDEQIASLLSYQAAAAVENTRLFRAHRALEERLLEANERLAGSVQERTAERDRLWSLSTDMMSVIAPDGAFAAANPAWKQHLGWEEDELIGRPFVELVHPEDAGTTVAEARRIIDTGGVMPHFENRQRHKDGGYRILSWSAVVDRGYVHAVGRDVTAEREAHEALEKARDQLRHSHRMEAIGVLARGVAHEFANSAAAVLAGINLLHRRHGEMLAENPSALRLLEASADAAKRGGGTARRLLSFAKRDVLKAEPIEVADLLERIKDGLCSSAAGAVNQVVVLPSGASGERLVADPAQLAAVLIALVMNARDAMPKSGGTVTFSATREDMPDGKMPGLFGGEYIRIDVADTGRGMDEATRQRAVEPFFTTHPESDGKGLGLSSALGFAEQSGGSLRIKSQEGVGTTISIWLPREARRAN